jgi:hypothetical protein
MSHLQDGASSSVGRDDASLSDYSALEMADLSPLLDVGAGQPANMELYEMEGYVLQSLELLASTPTPQYYGPEIVHSEALPRCKPSQPQPCFCAGCDLLVSRGFDRTRHLGRCCAVIEHQRSLAPRPRAAAPRRAAVQAVDGRRFGQGASTGARMREFSISLEREKLPEFSLRRGQKQYLSN